MAFEDIRKAYNKTKKCQVSKQLLKSSNAPDIQ